MWPPCEDPEDLVRGPAVYLLNVFLARQIFYQRILVSGYWKLQGSTSYVSLLRRGDRSQVSVQRRALIWGFSSLNRGLTRWPQHRKQTANQTLSARKANLARTRQASLGLEMK